MARFWRQSETKRLISKGDISMVAEWEWVTILNGLPIKNLNVTYHHGERAGIKPGGRLTVLSVSEESLIVKYTAPPHLQLMGTCCPDGAIFEYPAQRFLAQHRELIANARKKVEIKRRLIMALEELITE